ncbi:HEPN domain-containing protein [Desulfovibrio sulfodismutans]|uniref:HEPN domain-containing protein n=1 Tax=Desulfolutivibrio sulfodismutans TaxID=63561 RepID=A0A7K3NLY5_9BACT|nr:HEPN domain-containing protein [Desulfolutivibrio sulfodismutans]NDY57216.1 HEPN domain-containing protein [Desulfolutivibrio sulfodismutans]QLA13842.1 HEPN domain-containing protein [Desulfolutivibrio sulfodismutans DSM 3696]
MNDDVQVWLQYAADNLQAGRLLLENGLFNPCLQNAQQAAEKTLNACLLHLGQDVERTHGIGTLARKAKLLCTLDISHEQCDLLDSIYIPSKYPVYSVLPDFVPDADICRTCIDIADGLFQQTQNRVRLSPRIS